MKVSVIICAYTMERLNDIHEAVESVLAQTLRPHEIILSVDHNEELYESLQSLVVSLESHPSPHYRPKVVLNTGAQGPSETRNVGIRAASGDIVAFMDDDAVAEPDWLENLTKPFSQQPTADTQSPRLLTNDYRVVAVGGKAIPLWRDGKRPSWFPEELDWIIGCTYKGLPLIQMPDALSPKFKFSTSGVGHRTSKAIRNVPGCNMAFRKGILEQVGFWDEEIGSIGQSQKGGEEAELCLRINYEIPEALILYDPDAIIYHKVPRWRATLKWVIKNSLDQGACKAKLERLSFQQTQPTQRSLSTEASYLRYLLFTSIPERLKGFYKRGSLLQTGAIIMSIVATGVGYLIGRAKG